MNIKNIIFDFGGVLIDLDPTKTYLALGELMEKSPKDALALYEKNKVLFDNYEKGKVITENFLWNLQNMCPKIPQSHVIIAAWNAMLLGWNPDKLKFLFEIKQQYNIYLLSNTNEVHLDWVKRDLKKNHSIENFEELFFKKAYYSHLIEMRKPDLEIYQHVLQDADLKADETLFIDDNATNIEAAKSLGIFTHVHITNAPIDINKIIKNLIQSH
jgi:putative hydrolase of the HAD superfamily